MTEKKSVIRISEKESPVSYTFFTIFNFLTNTSVDVTLTKKCIKHNHTAKNYTHVSLVLILRQ